MAPFSEVDYQKKCAHPFPFSLWYFRSNTRPCARENWLFDFGHVPNTRIFYGFPFRQYDEPTLPFLPPSLGKTHAVKTLQILPFLIPRNSRSWTFRIDLVEHEAFEMNCCWHAKCKKTRRGKDASLQKLSNALFLEMTRNQERTRKAVTGFIDSSYFVYISAANGSIKKPKTTRECWRNALSRSLGPYSSWFNNRC